MNSELIQSERQNQGIRQHTKVYQKDLVREERGDKRGVLPVCLKRDWEQRHTGRKIHAVLAKHVINMLVLS